MRRQFKCKSTYHLDRLAALLLEIKGVVVVEEIERTKFELCGCGVAYENVRAAARAPQHQNLGGRGTSKSEET